MKKDRNTFFQESGFFNQANIPNMGIANQPFATGSYNSSSFYSGPNPNMPINYTTPMAQNQNYIDSSDIESRLSKLERQINRLDARITKLESNSLYTTDEIDMTNNVYMV